MQNYSSATNSQQDYSQYKISKNSCSFLGVENITHFSLSLNNVVSQQDCLEYNNLDSIPECGKYLTFLLASKHEGTSQSDCQSTRP